MLQKVFGGTHTGLVRKQNEDRFAVGNITENLSYAIVCDGMGGEKGGSIAAEISVNFASKILNRDLSPEMTELSIRAVFSSIFSASNALVFEAASKEPELKGMGTTMILTVLKDNQLYIGSVGDSRAYLISSDCQRQITTDHTIVQMMVESGDISIEEAQVHPKRNLITRAVGVSDSVEMDFMVEELDPEDAVLICSDGLYNYFATKHICPLVAVAIENQNVDNLIELALNGGAADNITAVVMV